MSTQRETFDQVPDLYAKNRPGVPAPAVEATWTRLGLAPGDAVLEVGCGSGQLTSHLLERGARVTAVEPGSALAGACERALGCPALTLVCSTFEAWALGSERFRAVTACQAAHWIEPGIFLERTAQALARDGRLGLLWHLDVSAETAFYKATQSLYDHYLPDVDEKPPRTIPNHVAAYEQALDDDARFARSPRERWPWTRTFDEAAYLGWLRTHSPVRMLSAEDREAFVAGHAEVIRAFDGTVVRRFETVLVAANRVD